MFQVSMGWLDGTDGVGYFNIADLESMTELGFHEEALDSSVDPYAISDEVVLVQDSDGNMQAVDFQIPEFPVVRSEVSADVATFFRWLGRSGDLVFFGDVSTFYALDVSDPDNLQVAYTISGQVTSMAVRGSHGVLSFASPATQRLRIYRLTGAGAPEAISPAFGGASSGSVSWEGYAVYTGDLAAYLVFDPSEPTFAGEAPVGSTYGTYVQDGFLVTAHGLYPTQCWAVANAEDIPFASPLLTASPNPFNPATEFAFEILNPGPVSMDIFNTQGRHVRRLLQQDLSAGRHLAQWNGRDEGGRNVPAGVYFARLTTHDGVSTTKVALVK